MNRQLFLSTLLASTFFTAQAYAFTPTCQYFGFWCSQPVTQTTNKKSESPVQTTLHSGVEQPTSAGSLFSLQGFFANLTLPKWSNPFSQTSSNQSQLTPVQTTMSLGESEQGANGLPSPAITPTATDFGVPKTSQQPAPQDKIAQPLLPTSAILDKQVKFQDVLQKCSDGSTTCIAQVLQSQKTPSANPNGTLSSTMATPTATAAVNPNSVNGITPQNQNNSLSPTYDPNRDISVAERNQAIQNGDIIPRGSTFDPNSPNKNAPQGYEYVGTVKGDDDHGEMVVNSYARKNETAPALTNLNFKSVCTTKGGDILPVNASGSRWSGVNEKLRNSVKLVSSAIGKAPILSSGYRSPAEQASICANRVPGRSVACGPGGSRHSRGEAVDLNFRGYTNEEKVKAILMYMSMGYSIINYSPDTHTHIGTDGGETRWVTNSTTPPPHTRKAFELVGARSGMSRDEISKKANEALKSLCQ